MAKKKRKPSKSLLAWSSCRMSHGIKPGQTMSQKVKERVQACVDKKLARTSMAGANGKKKRR